MRQLNSVITLAPKGILWESCVRQATSVVSPLACSEEVSLSVAQGGPAMKGTAPTLCLIPSGRLSASAT